MALATDPAVLILDEPTAGMSRDETTYIVDLIRDVTEGRTLLVVEHDMSVVFTLCDQISVLVYGEIIASGEPEAVRADKKVQEAYLGEEVALMAALLEVEGLHAHYDKSHILHGVSMTIGAGRDRQPARAQRLGPLDHAQGHHGAGAADRRARSASTAAISPASAPSGSPASASPTCRRSARSSPTSRSTRTCASACSRRVAGVPRWTVDQMFAFFPQLKERRTTAAGMLSGGEQQMLTICRSLLGNPRVILIDEPTEGLAPKIVEVVTEVIRDICRQGVSVLLVEQKLTIAMRVSTARLRDGPRPDRLRGHARQPARGARDSPRMARGQLRPEGPCHVGRRRARRGLITLAVENAKNGAPSISDNYSCRTPRVHRRGARVNAYFQVRDFVCEPICAEHGGQRPVVPHQKAGHVTVPDQYCNYVTRFG